MSESWENRLKIGAADATEQHLAFAEIERLRAIVEPLNLLRAEEASYVLIPSDNADFDGPGCLIEVFGAWTDYQARRVYGESLVECLEKAVEQKKAVGSPP